MHSPTTQCAVFVRLCMLMQQELAPAATSAMQHAATKYTLHLTSAEVLPRRRRTTRGTGASTRRRGSPSCCRRARSGAWCCAPGRCTTTCPPRGARGASATSCSCAWSRSRPSRPTSCSRRAHETPCYTPMITLCIRDILLVRLEQIAPFPSDLMFKARACTLSSPSATLSDCGMSSRPALHFVRPPALLSVLTKPHGPH